MMEPEASLNASSYKCIRTTARSNGDELELVVKLSERKMVEMRNLEGLAVPSNGLSQTLSK